VDKFQWSDRMHWLPLTVVVLIMLRLGAQLVLEALNRAEVRRNAAQRPVALRDVMDEATYAKSVEYTLAKSRFAAFETVFEVVVLLVLLFSGALPWLWEKFSQLSPGFGVEWGVVPRRDNDSNGLTRAAAAMVGAVPIGGALRF
jgi:hypothetical protein